MRVRKSVANLTAQEKAALVAGIKAMKADGKYDPYVLTHSRAMMTPSPPNVSPFVRNIAHRGPAFGPWHRALLLRFEQDLGVPLPYWDWTADQAEGSPETAPVWRSDLMGGNGVPPDDHVVDGPFAHDPNDPASWSTVQDTSLPANMQDRSVPWLTRRFGGMPGSKLPTAQDVEGALDVVPYDSAPWNTHSTPSFRNEVEGFVGPGLHNAAHMWVGGSMMPSTSPNDPVFFLHHANVDRIWANWQRKFYKTRGYLPSSGGPPGHNLNDPMLPWGGTTTPASVLNTFALGYWYDDAPPPNVTALSPLGGAAAGGTVVVIQGLGLMGATAVSFGPTATLSFTVDSDAQITARSPTGHGVVDVTVNTPIGTSAAGVADRFSYA